MIFNNALGNSWWTQHLFWGEKKKKRKKEEKKPQVPPIYL